jgi:TRAP-type C4-dicarboxylate transport system permease small subunit
MNAASTTLEWLRRLERWACALAFGVMVGVLAWDILGRELLGGGKIWARPVAVYANVFLAFIGMGVASAHGAHLRPRVFDRFVPASWNGLFDRFTDLGFALFAGGAAWLCWRMLQESIELAETDTVLPWPIWPFQGFLVAGFLLALVRHGLYALYPALRPAAQGGENAPPSEEQVREFAAEATTATTAAQATPATSPRPGAPR